MHILYLLVPLAIISAALATPIDPQRQLHLHRPDEQMLDERRQAQKDSFHYQPSYLAHMDQGQVKGAPTKSKYPSLRKGEYLCGGRVCKLTPGEIPPGCHGICQYPLPIDADAMIRDKLD